MMMRVVHRSEQLLKIQTTPGPTCVPNLLISSSHYYLYSPNVRILYQNGTQASCSLHDYCLLVAIVMIRIPLFKNFGAAFVVNKEKTAHVHAL
jgi:hypothetical protein